MRTSREAVEPWAGASARLGDRAGDVPHGRRSFGRRADARPTDTGVGQPVVHKATGGDPTGHPPSGDRGTLEHRPRDVRVGTDDHIVGYNGLRRGAGPSGAATYWRLLMQAQQPLRRFDARAMGTTISVFGPDVIPFDDSARGVIETFAIEEDRFSRFRSGSELSRVNATAGSWTTVSQAFASLILFALDQAAATDGLFDPTVLRAMEAAGYDRDLGEVIQAARGALHPPVACGRWAEVELDARCLRLPNDVGLDLGGVAKGWTVDLAAERALDAGLPWVLVSAGGDLRIAGESPPLEIEVEDPDEPGRALASLRLQGGAIATSSIRRRSWGPGLHHVIDPRTGAPSVAGVAQATVWGPTCAAAEIASTVALLEGPAGAARRASLLVAADGTVYSSFADAPISDADDDGVAA